MLNYNKNRRTQKIVTKTAMLALELVHEHVQLVEELEDALVSDRKDWNEVDDIELQREVWHNDCVKVVEIMSHLGRR